MYLIKLESPNNQNKIKMEALEKLSDDSYDI